MCVINITVDYDSFTECTGNSKDDISVIIKHLLLSIRGSVVILSLKSLLKYTTPKNLITSE